ncbi:hypothetical protein IPL85_01165 [Candidatus Saccharibacteria bacterium]|nr:MAG: hypothetical protein IPL85_01165 [Candidatus Saccharibacteria bacterium]
MRYRRHYLALVLLLVVMIGAVSTRWVFAEDYNVNAVVPYPAPSQAATIASPTGGMTFQNALQTVSGTCESIAPPGVVSVWRDGQILGSTSCTSGLYSLQIALSPGQNTLIARTANVNGVFGPDSAARVVTFTQAVVVEPLPPSVNQPSSNEQQTGASNAGSESGLTVTTQDPFSFVTSSNTEATIRVVIGGGESPYVLALNWGDGTTESHSINLAGMYEFTHTYRTAKAYPVHLRVRDARGGYTEYIYAVVSNTGNAPDQSKGGSVRTFPQSNTDWAGWYYAAYFIFFNFIFIVTYRFGYQRAKHRYETGLEQSTIKSVKKGTKRK